MTSYYYNTDMDIELEEREAAKEKKYIPSLAAIASLAAKIKNIGSY